MDNIIKIMFGVSGTIITGTFFIAGLYYTYKTQKEKNYSGKTRGKIIDNIMKSERIPDDDRIIYRRYYYALCEYMVGETKCVRETNIGTLQPKYKVGEMVTVYYNPNNCHESYIEGDNNSKFKAIVCFVLGIITSIFVYLVINFFLN